MTYLKIETLSDGVPLNFYLEVDDDNMEQRKIEIANGGLLGFASKQIEFRGTKLDTQPLISFEELVQLADTNCTIINKEEFEALWGNVIAIQLNV